MKENWLHFIWTNKLLKQSESINSEGISISILKWGFLNSNQGPDFLNAEVLIDGMKFYGHIEIHVDGDDWFAHNHQNDPNYNNVVLHVVWKKSSQKIIRQDNTEIIELCLEPLIETSLLANIQNLLESQNFFPCQKNVSQVPEYLKVSWMDRMGIERIKQKTQKWNSWDEIEDWEEKSWKLLLAAAGSPQNQDPFVQISNLLPYKLIKKYISDLNSLKALLFYVSGLNIKMNFEEEISTRWNFLKTKHNLLENNEIHFHYFRMRPNNFPQVRLNQVLDILQNFTNLSLSFENLIESKNKLFDTPNLTNSFSNQLYINWLLPLNYLYAEKNGIEEQLELVMNEYEILNPERNSIITEFENQGFTNKSAFESQSILHLFKEYCKNEGCLKCSLGSWLLKN